MKYLLIIASFMVIIIGRSQTDDCKTIYSLDDKESAYPRLSIDKKKILFQSNSTGKWQLIIMDLATLEQTKLTNDNYNNNFPDWSADGKWVAFVSDRDGNEEIYMMKSDGTELKRITNDKDRDIHPYFSPDGKYILFNSTRGNGSLDIYRYTLSTGKTEQFTNTPQNETCARYSPDMKTVVYLKNDDYTDDIYVFSVSNFLSTNITNTPLTTDGWPTFSSNGRHIYFSSMEKGTYSIYRINIDGTDRVQLTNAPAGEEHARVSISNDEKLMIYNLGTQGTIAICSCVIKS